MLGSFRRRIREVTKLREDSVDYRIKGASYKTDNRNYRRTKTSGNFQVQLEDFKKKLIDLIANGTPASFYKFGDGDYYFLNQKSIGSAAPGKRALSKNFSDIDMPYFLSGSKSCDYYMCEIPDHNRELYDRLFPGRQPDFPAEFIYGLIASRWIFEMFKKMDLKVGLIGASEKLKIIEELFQYEAYRSYIRIDKFHDYIHIPQKFACDDIHSLVADVGSKLSESDCDVYLVGVGHVKSGLMWNLPNFHNAIYLDVGSGIDALAGMIDTQRPYFWKWKNFILPNRASYQHIDYLQFNDRNRFYL